MKEQILLDVTFSKYEDSGIPSLVYFVENDNYTPTQLANKYAEAFKLATIANDCFPNKPIPPEVFFMSLFNEVLDGNSGYYDVMEQNGFMFRPFKQPITIWAKFYLMDKFLAPNFGNEYMFHEGRRKDGSVSSEIFDWMILK